MTRKDILDECEQDYDSPEGDLNVMADLWSEETGHTYTPVDMAAIMTYNRIARIKNGGTSEKDLLLHVTEDNCK